MATASEKSGNLLLPKYIWSVIATLGSLCAVLLASFFSWLGITQVHQGNTLELNGYKINSLSETVDRIEAKVSVLPPREFTTYKLRLEQLETDSIKRETQLDAVEHRVDKLEQRK